MSNYFDIHLLCEMISIIKFIFLLETSLGACSSIPCLNNATCFDASDEKYRKHMKHSDDYECYCRNGYSGKQCESKFATMLSNYNS